MGFVDFSANWLGVPPCWRAYFLLLRQKKVAKEKATPGSAPGFARFLALLGTPGGWLNSPAAQTTPADCPRHSCVAQRLPRGSEMRPHTTDVPPKTIPTVNRRKRQKMKFAGGAHTPHPRHSHLRGNDDTSVSPRVVSPGPLRGAEQRRKAGGSRRGLFEGQRPEFRRRPAFRVAQGTGTAGTDPGSPSFCLLFLGEARKSETPRKGGTPSQLADPRLNREPSDFKAQP